MVFQFLNYYKKARYFSQSVLDEIDYPRKVILPDKTIFTIPALGEMNDVKEEAVSTYRATNAEHKMILEQLNATVVSHKGYSFKGFETTDVQRILNVEAMENFQFRIGSPINLLFHSSNNTKSVVDLGFDIRFSNPRGLFGAAHYFANNSSKSSLYFRGTDTCQECKCCDREMLLCLVDLGVCEDRTTPYKTGHAPPGFNSIRAIPGPGFVKYDEFAVFNDDQAYPIYRVKYRYIFD